MPPVSSSPFLPRATPISVVVADDVVEIQQLLQHWLRELGCLVTCVSTGREAVRVLRTVHVDMVITDILMPDGDGLEVITELKSAQPSARVIAMSGGGSHLRATECLKFASGLGAHGVLMKPFNREQLLELVTQQLCPGASEKPA
jgi:CheY-like chemotaxis protein